MGSGPPKFQQGDNPAAFVDSSVFRVRYDLFYTAYVTIRFFSQVLILGKTWWDVFCHVCGPRMPQTYASYMILLLD